MIRPQTKALDLTHFPLVVLVLPPTLDSSYADVLEADTQAVLGMRAQYVSVSDATGVSGMSDAKTRKRMGEWAKSREDDFKRWQVANALYVGSGIVRAGISAVHWFAPPVVPTVVETDLGVALDFLRGHAARAGIDTAGVDAYALARRARLSGTGGR
jgi:hypothetical protein